MRKLTPEKLYRYTSINAEEFDPSKIKVEDRDVIEFMKRFHPRAYQSLNFGLHLKRNQNHIFIMGEPGVGRIGMTKALLNQAAKLKPEPKDVVLVSDFSDSDKTQYLYFTAGHGHEFKLAMEALITQLKSQLPIVFDGHAYQLRSQQLENELADKQQAILEPAFELAESLSIEIIQTENNFMLSAVVDDKRYKLSELKAFDEKVQEHFANAMDEVETALNQALTHFPFLQHEYLDAGKKLNTEVATDHIRPLIDSLKMEFGETDKIKQYLDDLQTSLVAKLHLFWDQSADQVTTPGAQISMEELLSEQQGLSIFEVNLLVDHRGLDSAPVIYEQNASMPKLFGYAINSAAASAVDTLSLAMSHQAGLLQQAHGGFLILGIQSVLKDPDIWSHLKAALMSKKITFEIPSSRNVVPYHLPDFPLNVTLVLAGQSAHFYALQEIDPEFGRLFKVQVEFEVELERTAEHEVTLARQLAYEVGLWEDLPIDVTAYECLIEYASRMAEDANRLYTNKAILRDVLAEANAYARANGEMQVTRKTIEETILQRDFHTGLMEDYYHRAIIEQQVLISLKGEHVGQVNGLTVLTVGKLSFGQPVRITAQASAGDEGVVDIEREVEMAGPIHSKGMLILSGYLRGRYMKQRSLGFSASIVMEQSYNGVEGDSASSAELLALISSIAHVPMRQDLAITGSINQFGEIQPIGGVNEKIEGFFKVCEARGLTGTQGVIVPEANAAHLMLSSKVRNAVEEGQFHVYTMSHIDDALGLLTGLAVGSENDDGDFPEGSVNAKVVAALEKMNEKHDNDD
ncbi:AAA family ATPase [Thiomicrorhabdus sp. ZW0627]|uniref:Lon protease family protein n=1 Tax=Thiomicrorhabdus sp. ZW0627 TaxID=3039774 RepID=UPI002436D3EE|nr:ATP-binding protein [Thiomicrorhabdus sp. ZW0627]MDG6773162.1 AAA family ATPase [Thiomicrorhabdus sp. ZW0627]